MRNLLDSWIQNLVLGTAQLSRSYGIESSTQSLTNPSCPAEILSEAFRLGIKKIDTSPDYGNAETHIGKFSMRNDCQIQTKFRFADSLNALAQVRKSIERMDLDTLWSAVLHDPSNLLVSTVDFSQELALLSAWNSDLRLGSSIYSPDEVPPYREFESFGAVVQLPAGVLIRGVIQAESIRILRKSGVRLQVRSLYMQGMLVSDKPIKRRCDYFAIENTREFLAHLSKEFNCSPHALLVAHGFETLGADEVVVGASHPSELEDLVKSLETVSKNLPEVCRRIDAFVGQQQPSEDEQNPLSW